MSEHSDNLLTSLHISLRDKYNGTFRGNIVLKNWTTWYGASDPVLQSPLDGPTAANSTSNGLIDSIGASYYVIAVILVYGMSIVALIASHIKRKKRKLVEDRQINKYLKEFQIVKEQSSRETYKNLKKRIKEQITWDKSQNKFQHSFQRNLSHALLPMIAVGVSVPLTPQDGSLTSINLHRSRSESLGQISLGGPRSRTSSVSSNSNTQFLASGERSPALSRDRHERKRGLANLFTGNNNNDFPLEKILEESLDSRTSSIRRKGSKKCKHSASSSVGSIHGILESLNQSQNHHSLSIDFPTRNSDLPEIHIQTSDNQSQILAASSQESDQALQQTVSSKPQSIKNKKHSPVDKYPTMMTRDRDAKKTYLAVPKQRSLSDERIWVFNAPLTDREEESMGETYNNGGFRHSPSPVKSKSRGNSPVLLSKNEGLDGGSDASADPQSSCEQMLDSSDSETEQLLQITCV